MRRFALMALGLVFMSCSSAQEKISVNPGFIQNDLEEMGLKGKVRSIGMKEYELSDQNSTQGTLDRVETFKFNKKGNKTEESYESMGEYPFYMHTVYEYNADGLLVMENMDYKPEESREYVVWSKHKNGKPVLGICYSNDTLAMVYTCTYNAMNRPLKTVTRDSTDHLTYTNDYVYDKKGNLAEQTIVMGPDDKSVYRYTYDEKGELTEEIHTYPDKPDESNHTTYKIIERDEKGNWTLKLATVKWNSDIGGSYETYSRIVRTIVYE